MAFQDIVSELKIVRNFLEVERSEVNSKAFSAQLANVTRLFERECAEAKDREVRLQNKVGELSNKLAAAIESIEVLSAKIDGLAQHDEVSLMIHAH